MKKVLDKQTVAHLWAHQTQKEGYTPTRNFKFDGRELASYGTSIGYHFDEFVLLSRNRFSATTSKHLFYANNAASHLKRIESDIFIYGNRYYADPSSRLIIQDQEDRLEKLYKDLIQPRIRMTTKAKIASELHYTADIINYLIKHFKVNRKPVKLPADLEKLIADSKVTIERINAEREAAAKKKEQAARRKNAAVLKQWLDGEDVYLPYGRQKNNGSDLLTVRGEEVLTTQGATAPLKHVVKAIDFYNSRTSDGLTFKQWHSNGHKIPLGVFTLDGIDEQGTVRAGCHTFTHAEIMRFISKWIDVINAARKED